MAVVAESRVNNSKIINDKCIDERVDGNRMSYALRLAFDCCLAAPIKHYTVARLDIINSYYMQVVYRMDVHLITSHHRRKAHNLFRLF